MSKHTAPEQTADGETMYLDAEDTTVRLYVAPAAEDGLVDLSIGKTGHPTETFALDARDRVALAMQLLDGVPDIAQGTPAKNQAKYQVIVDTTTHAAPTEAGIDRLLQRLAWHLRNGIPARVIEPEGGVFTLNEVSEGEVPPRMSETRRHFRYHLPTDPDGDWHYHHNFKKITAEGGVDIEFQRTYKSEWETI